MFMLYKNLKWIFIAGCILLAIPLVVGVIITLDALLYFPLFLLVTMALAIVLEMRAQKRLQTLHTDLLDNCQAMEYIAAYQQLLMQPAAQRRAVCRQLQMDMAIGYDALGDHRSAIQLTMQMLPIDIAKKSGQQEWLVYCNNLAAYYLNANDVENGKKAIADMKQALAAADKNSPQYTFFSSNVNKLENDLAILEGEGAGVRKTMEIELANASTRLSRVGICQSLAMILLQADETDKAAEYLEEMVQLAGDTRFGPWAQAKLQELQKQ